MIAHILTDNSLTVILEGKAHTIQVDHPNWDAAIEALKSEDADKLASLLDLAKAVKDYVDGNVEIKDGAVIRGGEVVHNVVVDKILDFMRKDLPFVPLLRFLDKLMENPSRRAVNELYTFLEHKNMPLTSEGNFVAYKGVTTDFKDHYSRKFDNSVGCVLEMRRNAVCDNADQGCSAGFHAGSYEYAKGYAHNGGNLMLVEIDPSDVVSVPTDCSCQKLRTAKYKVVAHVENIEAPPLDEGIYGDYDDPDNDVDAAWYAGYEAAKEELEN
jgi:hypothetical protein